MNIEVIENKPEIVNFGKLGIGDVFSHLGSFFQKVEYATKDKIVCYSLRLSKGTLSTSHSPSCEVEKITDVKITINRMIPC